MSENLSEIRRETEPLHLKVVIPGLHPSIIGDSPKEKIRLPFTSALGSDLEISSLKEDRLILDLKDAFGIVYLSIHVIPDWGGFRYGD